MAKTVLKESSGSVNVLSSRFETLLLPLSGQEEFETIYKAFKKRFPKADHYPYAFIYEGAMKSSDAGEPSGAAGKGFLELLKNHDISRGCLISARYFGGSKLGLPRLHRTFMASAEEALSKAILGQIILQEAFSVTLSYHDYEILKRSIASLGGALSEERFEEKVTLKLSGDATILSSLSQKGLTLEATPLGIEETIKETQNDPK